MRFVTAIFVALLLAACSGPDLPFSKNEASNLEAVKPPWEALVQAGPNAANELDFETLDGPTPQAVDQPLPELRLPAEKAESVAIEDIKTASNDKPKSTKKPKKDENAVAIKAVAVVDVTGNAEQGNVDLTNAMRDVLREAGWPVLKAPRKDAITITGTVKMSAPKDGKRNVELLWLVATPAGKKLGEVKQKNTLPVSAFEGGWGDNARYAAEAAAAGIFQLIDGLR